MVNFLFPACFLKNRPETENLYRLQKEGRKMKLMLEEPPSPHLCLSGGSCLWAVFLKSEQNQE
ncbi:hypothetical protein FHS90_001596 [Rufibacter quisquiliarum]|uniref:Uncharacterized protein n=1 Tax=Rufibacter quisquiliarum TaxID=1549639 RepID=A0A839GR59_9BACT|nr:hypothetical protein [Rufibacter quisquiliarum]